MDRDLTLIDVDQCCLVKAPGTSRYVTLSYVWGKDWQLLHVSSNHDVLFRPGALAGSGSAELADSSNAPLGKVVTDSMAITARIGERYLWIDALCIKQDEGEAKALELMRMASIYNCAVVSIVPIDGASSHTPIPGLGSAKRGETADSIFDGLSISVKKDLDRIVVGSVYNTRGWCFQEAFLSRRMLFFSEEQVFFRCQESTRSEDL
ncbi:heterokaryon incompatibility protein-domain-containing protein, partial [Coniella lustricola]